MEEKWNPHKVLVLIAPAGCQEPILQFCAAQINGNQGGLSYHSSELSEDKCYSLLPFSIWRKISSTEEQLNASFCACLIVDSSDQSCEIKSEGNWQTHQWSNKTFTMGANDSTQWLHQIKPSHRSQLGCPLRAWSNHTLACSCSVLSTSAMAEEVQLPLHFS